MITDQIGLHAVLLPLLINFGEALIMKLFTKGHYVRF